MNDLEFMNNNINSKENRLHIFIKRRKLKKMSKKLENLTCIILQELNTFKKSLEKQKRRGKMFKNYTINFKKQNYKNDLQKQSKTKTTKRY